MAANPDAPAPLANIDIGSLLAQARMASDIENIKTNVSDLRTDVREIRGELREIHAELGQIHGDLGEIHGDLRAIRGELGEVRSLSATKVELGALATKVELAALATKVDRGFLWLVSFQIGTAGTLLAAMAHGFRWI